MKNQNGANDLKLGRLSNLKKLDRDQMKHFLGGSGKPGTCTTNSCSLGCAKDGYCSTCCLA